MIHSATASDMLVTPAKASPISLGNPMEGTDLPTASSAAVRGGEICRCAHGTKGRNFKFILSILSATRSTVIHTNLAVA